MHELADADARSLIVDRGLTDTLFVEAGAGSGKTSQLVERVVNLVCRRGADMGSIAAITFTEAAAAELRVRVREEFQAQLHDPEAEPRAREALEDIDAMVVSTLHSFAQRVLRLHGGAIGLPPDIEVMDEVESQLAFDARWRRFLDSLYARSDRRSLLIRSLLLDVPIDSRTRVGLRDVALQFNDNWDQLDGFVRADRALRPIAWSRLRDHLDALESALERCTDDEDRLFTYVRDTLLPTLLALTGDRSETHRLRVLAAFAPRKLSRTGRAASWTCEIGEIRELATDAIEAISHLRETATDGVLPLLAAELADFTQAMANERAESGRLEFHDLLVLARRVVCEHAASRRSLHERYRHIFLDEFQDTDPLQIEIAVAIASGDAFTGRWETSPTPPGSLFFVGDPKQSIYRFRRADIGLFLEARDRFGGDSTVRLTQNFRTVGPIVAFVNATFAHLMPEEVAGAQPKYEPLVAVRAGGGVDHRPTIFGGQHPKGTMAAHARSCEATDAAALIAAMLQDPSSRPVHDRRSDRWRPMRANDIAIIVPTRASLPFLTAALSEAGIDHHSETGALLYSSDAVREVLGVLHAVDDPSDHVAVVGALRSSALAVPDTELARWAAAGHGFDYLSSPAASTGGGRVGAALRYIADLHAARWWCTPSEMIERVVSERGMLAAAYASDRPTERVGALRFLVDQARAFCDAEQGDLRRFLQWARRQEVDGARVQEPIENETENSVRIVTAHGAKGLEYPIVVLSGLTTKLGRRSGGVSVHYGDEHSPPQLSLTRAVESVGFDRRRELEAQMDAHEALRLLYVATTRACDHLFVSAHHIESIDSHGATFDRAATEAPDLVVRADRPARVAVEPPPIDSAACERLGHLLDERQRLVAEQPSPTPEAGAVIAASSLADSSLVDDSVAEHSTETVRDGTSGTSVGLAYHAVMEAISFDDRSLVATLCRETSERFGVAEASADIAAMVHRTLDTHVIALARSNPHHREVLVSAPLEDRLVEGYVDLVVETDGGLVIVDYKSDAVSVHRTLEAVYRRQLAAYAHALERSTGSKVARAVLVGAAADPAAEITIDLVSAMRDVAKHIRDFETGPR